MQLVEETCGGSCFVWQRQVDVTGIVGDNHRLRPEKLGLPVCIKIDVKLVFSVFRALLIASQLVFSDRWLDLAVLCLESIVICKPCPQAEVRSLSQIFGARSFDVSWPSW